MRQKLGVIAAMLHQPELLVLDEPTTGVDPVSRSGLWWLIAGAAAEGCAVVLATTYLDEAERCSLGAGAGLTGSTLAPGRPTRSSRPCRARSRDVCQARWRGGRSGVAPRRQLAGLVPAGRRERS